MIDAHLHLEDHQLGMVLDHQVTCLVNGTTPSEWHRNKHWEQRHPAVYASYGVHPWQAGRFDPKLLAAYAPCVIGETGLDSVWCSVPLKEQQRCFVAQLELASASHSPVVLHTKGQELQVLKIIRQYKLSYLVHWYDDTRYLEDYLALGCFFTLPANLRENRVAQYLLRHLPVQRLLPESDGLSALEWAFGRTIHAAEYPDLLQSQLSFIAQQKEISLEKLQSLLLRNFHQFVPAKSLPI